MQSDLELGRIHRRQNVRDPNENNAFSTVRQTLANLIPLRKVIIDHPGPEYCW